MRAALTARPLYTLALSTILAAAIGFAVAVFVVSDSPPGDDSAEAGFARDMSLHHSQAVTMSMYLVENGEDEQLGYIAYDIALTQQGQIGQMNAWLNEWDLEPTSTDHMEWMSDSTHDSHGGEGEGGVMPGMASQQQLDDLMDATGTEADLMFCELMITHHMAGITMAEAVIDGAEDPEVVRVAKTMVKGQQSEVNVLTEIKDRLESED